MARHAMNIAKLIDKGEEALKKKNFDYAIEILLQAVSFGPNNRRARELLRQAELRKYEHAYPSKGMVAVFGLPARLGMAVAGLSKKSNPEAYMMACEKFLTKDPKSKAANMALGEAAALGGHLEAAIFAYQTASEHNPGDPAAMKKLGQLLWKNGQISEAHEVYDKVVRLRPQDQEAIKARKNLAAEMSLKETGFESARSSRELVKDKDAAGKLEQETRIYQTSEDLETRRAKIEERLEAEPNDTDALEELANIAKRLKDWDTAVQAMDKALELKPDDTTLVFARGDLHIDRLEERKLELLRAGKEAEAGAITKELLEFQVEEYRKRVKIYPTDLNLRFKLGELLYGRGQLDEAIGEFQQTVRDPKFRAESQLRLGRAFKVKSQYDLALRQLNQALEGQTGLTERVKEIRYEMGDVYQLMGRKAEAKSEFGKIYEQDIAYRDVASRLADLEKDPG
jgi:tetratricopeptide (TPR) repeat protein